MTSKRKLGLAVAVVFAVNILVYILVMGPLSAEAAVYRQGSAGSTVKEIQQRLKDWGYYSGGVDGIYGSKTVAAVKWFQQKNKLAVDGITGKATLAALGIRDSSATPASSALNNDTELLARLITAEARGEPYTGQVSVGAVVLNRIRHPSFPGSISGVIYQNGAFTCLDDGQWSSVTVNDTARKAAKDALNGWDPTGGAIYYYNPSTATNKWIRSRPILTSIGRHVFCG
ncbi:MAG: spore cortex-lytic enzyme [Oscillospiraceae bacterium]|jgi:N-acetylmuramoyl-L-alanine amidase|nr:spore cortex-lytic enzyme [Oscillospiraceae bacterium]